ncbi:MAG: tRNA 4-thiouridine(8) synthase ThiI [Erysipelotrichaceae bacterium]|nr:tRNA 4-thiouridine(8) synthase ThiI [Erysipelotrichaceae bacterium]
MKYDSIMVRYGELTLKGKNKKSFIDTLDHNIRMSLNDMKSIKFEKQYDRFYIHLHNDDNEQEIIHRLKNIPGIHNFSLVLKVAKDLEEIASSALKIVLDIDENVKTFKVKASRSDKEFAYISDDINRYVAAKILKNTSLKVDVHNPDIIIKVEIRKDNAYVSIITYEGLNGLPLGSSGKSLLMISGGIDSPVAGYLMMKRGVKIEAIHFSSPPYTSNLAVDKVKTLLQTLAKVQGQIKFINIPFTAIQEKIYEVAGDKYAITIMRRMMYRIADIVANNDKCLCIVNGESIGQVASQTLDSMQVINEVTNKVIIRPLATFDKLDIIRISKEIGTYDTSILPYEDCCTIFDPKNPTTKPKLKDCEFYESKFDYQNMILEAIANATIENIIVE